MSGVQPVLHSLARRAVTYAKKTDPMLRISACLMALSFLWAPPGAQTAAAVDWRVIAILFSLMLVIEHLKAAGLFRAGARQLLHRVRDRRLLGALLVTVCFLTSMLITNDVALLTFVPFTILLFGGTSLSRGGRDGGRAQGTNKRSETGLIDLIILETAAANLGSQCTPLGNPQNLYLYYHYGLDIGTFLRHMLPPAGLAVVWLAVSVCFLKRGKVDPREETGETMERKQVVIWMIAFFVCILSVLRFVPYFLLAAGTIALSLLSDRRTWKKVDYSILLIFVCLFVFVDNLLRLHFLHTSIIPFLQRHVYISAILSAQLISNVPAATLFAPLTSDWRALLYAVNVSGMGTLIASMASLISYKLYAARETADKKCFLLRFFIYNFLSLVVLASVTSLFL